MKRYIAVLILVIILTLTGCGKKTVSYKDNQSEEKESCAQHIAEEETPAGSLKEVLNLEDKWKETMETENGNEIIINAKVQVPDASAMYTQELSRYYYNAQDKKRIAQYFLEPESIELNRDAIPTKEQLRQDIETWREELAAIEQEDTPDDGYITLIKNEIKRMEGLISEAPDEEDVQTKEFDYKENHYKGTKDDIEYILTFDSDETRNVSSWSLMPTAIETYNTIGATGFGFGGNTVSKLVPSAIENKCSMTKEEVEEQAERICEELGLPDMEAESMVNILWINMKQEEEANGYCVSLVRTINGVATKSTTYQDDRQSIYLDTESQKQPYRQEKINIAMNDKGIVYMEYSGILSAGETKSVVKLLDFEQIKETLRKELSKKQVRLIYNIMELGYVRVLDEKEEGIYSYIPVWKLSSGPEDYFDFSNVDPYECILLNAIDGSRIYPKEQELIYYVFPEDTWMYR